MMNTAQDGISGLRDAARMFQHLGMTSMESAANLSLGAALCTFSWESRPGKILLDVACEAAEILSRVERVARSSPDCSLRSLHGAALSWRARTYSVLADHDPALIQRVLTDANEAVDVLDSGDKSRKRSHRYRAGI